MPNSPRKQGKLQGREMTTVEAYQRRFVGLELAHAGAAELRARALASFAEQGFPTKKHEEWRYTSVKHVVEREWRHERGDPAYQLAGGVTKGIAGDEPLLGSVASLARAPFVALNTAFFQRGYAVVAAEGERIVLLEHRCTDGGAEVHPRGLVVVKAGARLTLVEQLCGEGFVNHVEEIVVEEGGVLEHHLWQRVAQGGVCVSTVAVRIAAGARYDSFGLWLGGGLSRVDLHVALAGEGARCRVDGVYAACGGQLVDVHSAIEHAVPRCTSRQVYKGVMGEGGHGVFHGKVLVRPDAQGSDAAQENHNLLLADTAEIDTKPQLEIFADDVKCSHGATVGQLDDEQLFYLMSRGLPPREASHMLTDAFATTVLDPVANADVSVRARQLVREKLEEMER